jgi:hypothetical protein
MKHRYGNSTYGPRGYDQELKALFERVKRKHGFVHAEQSQSAPPQRSTQLSLGFG